MRNKKQKNKNKNDELAYYLQQCLNHFIYLFNNFSNLFILYVFYFILRQHSWYNSSHLFILGGHWAELRETHNHLQVAVRTSQYHQRGSQPELSLNFHQAALGKGTFFIYMVSCTKGDSCRYLTLVQYNSQPTSIPTCRYIKKSLSIYVFIDFHLINLAVIEALTFTHLWAISSILLYLRSAHSTTELNGRYQGKVYTLTHH